MRCSDWSTLRSAKCIIVFSSSFKLVLTLTCTSHTTHTSPYSMPLYSHIHIPYHTHLFTFHTAHISSRSILHTSLHVPYCIHLFMFHTAHISSHSIPHTSLHVPYCTHLFTFHTAHISSHTSTHTFTCTAHTSRSAYSMLPLTNIHVPPHAV